jgi:hypothetical protein
MSRNFTEKECDMLDAVAVEEEEFYYETRKGIPQTKYVFEVYDGQSWDDWANDNTDLPVPEEFVGFWVMSYASDLSDTSLNECIRDYPWVKCIKQEVTTHKWVKV